jgi:glycosyltransferase involved in cell wall biosynthesis
MKNVLFISKGESASSTRYRALQYFSYFIAAGWQPKHVTISGGIIAIVKTFIAAKNADVVVLLRKTFPYPILWILRKLSKKLIFDFDDAIFCNTDGSYSITRSSRFKTTVLTCDHVFAGNEYLATEARKFNSATTVIPTSVDTHKYNLQCEKDSDYIQLVWIGSSSTRKYLEEILPFLEDAAQLVPNLQLKVIADFELFSERLQIKTIHWSEKTEAIELCKADIGLAPMPEDNWTKGKCALKVLQYMAAGLPVLSSQSGVNAYVIEDRVNGFLASSNTQWAEQISQMSKNKTTLLNMGDCGRRRVQTEFSIEVVFQKMFSILSDV